MEKRTFSLLGGFTAISLLLVGGFFYTQGVAAQTPSNPPDLTITKATLDGAALRFQYHNRGEGPAQPEVSFWYEWVDGQGRRIGELYWINVGGMGAKTTSDGNQLLDFSTLQWRHGQIKLADLVYFPPPGATHLKLAIDGPNAHSEANEQNNVVLLPVLRTDFTITDAEFRNDFPWYKYHNRGNLGSPAGKMISFWFEWVDAPGARLGDLHWLEVEPPSILSSRSASLARSTSFDSETIVFSAKGATKLTAFLNSAPQGSTHLKIAIDGPNAYAESNEGNNVALIDRAQLAAPEIDIQKPDLTFYRISIPPGRSWLAIEYKNLETTVGTPEFSWTVYWVDGAGKQLGTAYRGVGRALKPWGASGTSSDLDVPLGKWLAQPKPAGAVRLEFIIDPENLIAETNEVNNRTTFEGWVPQDTTVQPDLTIVAVELKDELLSFIYRNDGKGPANNISIWFHFANSVGAQIGPLYWLDVESVAPYRGRHFTSKDVIVGSDAGPRPLTEVLRQGLAEATHFKILMDGPHNILELNELNNTALVKKSAPEAEKLPDLALIGGSRSGGVVRLTIVNGTPDTLRLPFLQFKWLDANGAALATSPVSYWQNQTIAAGKTGDFTLEYERWREDGVTRFLKHPPSGAVALLTTIDPENKLKESNEENNAFRIALDQQPDLTLGTVEVRYGALRIEVKNVGSALSKDTDVWLMWFGAKGSLPASGAMPLPVLAGGATTMVVVPLDGKTEVSRILREPPKDGTRVRIFLDGSRKVEEVSEQNNDGWLDRALLPKPEQDGAPELTLTLAVETISRAQAAVSLPATVGLIVALIALLGGGFLIVRYKLSKRLLPVVLITASLTGIAGATFVFAAATPEAQVGDTLSATLRAKNNGAVRAQGITLALPCPDGTLWKETRLNGVGTSHNASKGISAPDLEKGASHELQVTCLVEEAALAKQTLRFLGTARAKDAAQAFVSNAVDIKVRPQPKLEQPPKLEAKPDLAVEAVGILSPGPVEGADLPFVAIFTGLVKNRGDAASPASSVRLRIDVGGDGTWEIVSDGTVPDPEGEDAALFEGPLPLGPGMQTKAHWTVGWGAPLERHVFEICVDPEGKVKESDETNNCAQDQFWLEIGKEPILEPYFE